MPREKAAVNTAEFYIGLISLGLLLMVITWLFPHLIPFSLTRFFGFQFDAEKLSHIPWMLLLFGPGLALIASIFTKRNRYQNINIVINFKTDIWTSIKAGIFEEASYRWLTFYYLIMSFTLDNMLINYMDSIGYTKAITDLPWWAILCVLVVVNLVGLIAYIVFTEKGSSCLIMIPALIVMGLVLITDLYFVILYTKWWYTAWLIPAIDTLTLGQLHNQLYEYSWMVGAAIISSNGKFRDGHAYQGCLGIVNSWIFGMLMFWFTFNFGLFFAMFVHALYDIVITIICYIDARIELARQ